MKFLLNCFATDHYDHCNYAVVDITLELTELIKRRKTQFDLIAISNDPAFKLCYFDYWAVYYSSCDLDPLLQEQIELFESYGLIELPSDFILQEKSRVSVESSIMVLYEDFVCWTSIIKHTEVRVETESVMYDRIFK
jgi:hypothetical protein